MSITPSDFAARPSRRHRLAAALAPALVGLGALAVGVGPVAAVTEPNWSTPVDVSAGDRYVDSAEVATTADGTRAVAVWLLTNDDGETIVAASVAAISNGAATWSTPVEVSNGGSYAAQPRVAIADNGSRAIVVWRSVTLGQPNRILSSTIDFGVTPPTWSAQSTVQEGRLVEPRVSITSDGTRALALWTQMADAGSEIAGAVASISGSGPTWSTSTVLSNAGADQPNLTLQQTGTTAVAVWVEPTDSGSAVKASYLSVAANGITGSTPATLTPPEFPAAYEPCVVMAANGQAVTAAWRADSNDVAVMQTASGTLGANGMEFSAATTLTEADYDAYEPNLAVSGTGSTAILVWHRYNENYELVVQAATATVSGKQATWSTPKTLTAPGSSGYEPQVTLSFDGRAATALWSDDDGELTSIQSAVASISNNVATWSAPTYVSGANESYGGRLASSSTGAVGVNVWTGPSGDNRVVSSSILTAPGSSGPTSAPVHDIAYWRGEKLESPALPVTIGWMDVTTDRRAKRVLSVSNCPSRYSGTRCLGAQLLAAKLNRVAGADTSCIETTIATSDRFLRRLGYWDALRVPTPGNTMLRWKAQRLSSELARYNASGCSVAP